MNDQYGIFLDNKLKVQIFVFHSTHPNNLKISIDMSLVFKEENSSTHYYSASIRELDKNFFDDVNVFPYAQQNLLVFLYIYTLLLCCFLHLKFFYF